MKLIFSPVGILAGILAAFAAQKSFERIWALIDAEDPPEPDERQVSYPKLVAALALEGAIFRLVKGMADRGSRVGFASLTGRWPGAAEGDPQ